MIRARLVAVLVVVSVLLMVSGASAQEEEVEGALLLIMDSSGSMNETDDAGTPLIQSAKQALNEVVSSLPADTPAGLRVYGHRVPNSNRAEGCRDTELIVPVGPLDETQMRSAIDGYQARGWTPIGLSLQEGAEDLPPEGPRTIVLVSDGEDTCGNPPPCQVARDLSSQGVDVTIETVGFFVRDNPDAQEQLRCIAEETGGSYHDANSADDLADELTTISTRAARTFQAGGQRVEGGPSSDSAPVLEPGTYQDTIVPDESLWYAVELEEGQEVRTRATVGGFPDVEDTVGAYLVMNMYNPLNEEILDPGSQSQCCAGATAVSVGNTTGTVDPDETYAYEAGAYYVQVSLEDRVDELQPREFPLELEFQVTGQAPEETTVEQTTVEQTTVEQTTVEQTTVEQTTPEQTQNATPSPEPTPQPQTQGTEPPPPPVEDEGPPVLAMMGLIGLGATLVALPAGVVVAVLVLRRR